MQELFCHVCLCTATQNGIKLCQFVHDRKPIDLLLLIYQIEIIVIEIPSIQDIV